jgi:glutathione synthase/RimK-type ligase-like ATP-grasp enzyme
MTTVTKKLGTSELLFRQADRMGLKPVWVTPNGLFAISTPQGERYVNFATSSLNSHISASLAKNKYLTRVVLGRSGVPNIPFCRPKTMQEALLFLLQHKKIVVKPYDGWGAHDIRIVTTAGELAGIVLRDYIFEKYIAGREMRILVLNDNVVGVHESRYGVSVEATRDLERISYHASEWDAELVASSLQVTRTLGLRFAAVDYLVDDKGTFYLLEVNSSPGLKWFHAPTAGPPVDVAALFLEATLS